MNRHRSGITASYKAPSYCNWLAIIFQFLQTLFQIIPNVYLQLITKLEPSMFSQNHHERF